MEDRDARGVADWLAGRPRDNRGSETPDEAGLIIHHEGSSASPAYANELSSVLGTAVATIPLAFAPLGQEFPEALDLCFGLDTGSTLGLLGGPEEIVAMRIPGET